MQAFFSDFNDSLAWWDGVTSKYKCLLENMVYILVAKDGER